jgi:pimeloyl-ACP methyl ester carboxylesterase
MLKNKNKFAISFCILLFSFLFTKNTKAIEVPDEEKWTDYDNYIVINQDTTWSSNLVFNNIEKPIVVVDGATLTIEKGSHIELFQLKIFYGRIVAEGTAQENIVFTRAIPDLSIFGDEYNAECFNYQNGLIEFDEWAFWEGMEPSFMRYVEFSNMGSFKFIDHELCSQEVGWNKKLKRFFFNTAYAQETIWPDVANPALKFLSGRLHIENSSFLNNSYADIEANLEAWEEESESYLEVINSNFSGNVQETALISDVKRYDSDGEYKQDGGLIILKNNWYGEATGPRVAPDYILGGEMLKGDYTLDGFRMLDLIVDPVIFIPGIMGSTEVIGEWKLDPILRTYRNLIESFEKNGYAKNFNLFEFPYEWRNKNLITAENLQNKAQEIRDETKISKVDLVAHSMGGLVARYYIENLDQENNVDQLITLGTPHKGAPGSYLTLEAGEVGTKFEDYIIKKIFQVEADHSGYNDLGKYIREKVLSVGELLPIYDYLYDVSGGEMKNYSNGYPKNDFLEALNEEGRLDELGKVEFTNIIGDTEVDETISRFRVVDSTVAESWEHGMPENFYDPSTDRGIEYGQGDETVSLEGSEIAFADETIKIDSAHNDLPTEAQCYVVEKLTRKDDCDYVNAFTRIKSILTFGIFSPIDIQVISPSGKWAGKNILSLDEGDQIEGAYYTGFETENEFLTIPNPEDGEYRIITEGTDTGEYRIELAKITEDEKGEAREITGEITGSATAGIQEEKVVEVLEGQIITGEEEDEDTTPPTIEIASPQNKIYQSDEIIPIDLSVTDDDSGVDEEKTKTFLDGETFSSDKIDMAYLEKGEHRLKVSAEDNSGNSKEEIVVFTAWPTIDSIIKNVDHYHTDKYIIRKSTINYLRAKLNVIKIHQSLYDLVKFSHWPKRFKNRVLKNLDRNINREIDRLISDIQSKKTIFKTILEPVAGILVGNLEEMKSF